MILKNQELIEEYFENNKYEYPDLTLEQFKEICFSPWRYTKENMESGELPKIRLKYFGVLQVYEGRASNMLTHIKNKFEKHTIEPKQYFKVKEMIEKFLKQFNKNED